MKKFALYFSSVVFISLSLHSCIGDDFLEDETDPVLRITNKIDSLKAGDNHEYNTLFFNNIGQEDNIDLQWSSSNTSVATISSNGVLMSVDTGATVITVSGTTANGVNVSDIDSVIVGDTTVTTPICKSGTVNTTSTYALFGDFTIKPEGNGIKVNLESNYNASTALPGLYVYLSNNPNSSAGAYEIGPVTVFSGAHSYTIPSVGINDYQYLLYFCKPFNVKVGHGEIL